MSSRRDFLRQLAPMAAAGTALTVTAKVEAESLDRDEFTYRGWRVCWGGWRTPANQAVTLGVWLAQRSDERQLWYATTLGCVERAYECEVFDCNRYREDWPSPVMPSPQDQALVKRLARDELLAKLRGERIRYDEMIHWNKLR